MSDERIERLEAQMNALAQAWLHLAATAETTCGLDPETLERGLLSLRLPNHPQEAEFQRTLETLCNQLSDAREHRRYNGLPI